MDTVHSGTSSVGVFKRVSVSLQIRAASASAAAVA